LRYMLASSYFYVYKYCNRQTNGVHVDEDVKYLVNLDDGRRGLVI